MAMHESEGWAAITALARQGNIDRALEQAKAMERRAKRTGTAWMVAALILLVGVGVLGFVARDRTRAATAAAAEAYQARVRLAGEQLLEPMPRRISPRLIRTADDLVWFFETAEGKHVLASDVPSALRTAFLASLSSAVLNAGTQTTERWFCPDLGSATATANEPLRDGYQIEIVDAVSVVRVDRVDCTIRLPVPK